MKKSQKNIVCWCNAREPEQRQSHGRATRSHDCRAVARLDARSRRASVSVYIMIIINV